MGHARVIPARNFGQAAFEFLSLPLDSRIYTYIYIPPSSRRVTTDISVFHLRRLFPLMPLCYYTIRSNPKYLHKGFPREGQRATRKREREALSRSIEVSFKARVVPRLSNIMARTHCSNLCIRLTRTAATANCLPKARHVATDAAPTRLYSTHKHSLSLYPSLRASASLYTYIHHVCGCVSLPLNE